VPKRGVSALATNTLAGLGLLYSRLRYGASPTYQANKYKIKKGYATAIGIGDVVQTDGANLGYIKLAADGAAPIVLGIFAGVLPYFDLSAQQTMNGLNGSWPTTANPSGDVDCLVIDDPAALFRVQVSGGPWAQSWRGQNMNWVAGTNGAPNASGISTLVLNGATVAVTAGFPFRVQELVGVTGGPQDPANTNPWIEVAINFGVSEEQVGLGV
jgi:hypothetical protein